MRDLITTEMDIKTVLLFFKGVQSKTNYGLHCPLCNVDIVLNTSECRNQPFIDHIKSEQHVHEEAKIYAKLGFMCKNCGQVMEFKKELNKEGYCYACNRSIVDTCRGAIGDFETNICLHYLNKWLLKLKKGKTAEKYADKQVAHIPKNFYKQWAEACGV